MAMKFVDGYNLGLDGRILRQFAALVTKLEKASLESQNLIRPGNLNPFLNKPWFLLVCSTSLLKIVWEKEKLLVMSLKVLVWKRVNLVLKLIP